jgi:hypothetical protein
MNTVTRRGARVRRADRRGEAAHAPRERHHEYSPFAPSGRGVDVARRRRPDGTRSDAPDRSSSPEALDSRGTWLES